MKKKQTRNFCELLESTAKRDTEFGIEKSTLIMIFLKSGENNNGRTRTAQSGMSQYI